MEKPTVYPIDRIGLDRAVRELQAYYTLDEIRQGCLDAISDLEKVEKHEFPDEIWVSMDERP